MPDDFDYGGFGRLVERLFGRARMHSNAWIAAWLAGILAVTAVAAIFSAPVVAYVILLMVADVALNTAGSSGGPS